MQIDKTFLRCVLKPTLFDVLSHSLLRKSLQTLRLQFCVSECLRQLTDQKWVKKLKVKVPLVHEPSQVKGRFRFLPPRDVHVTGSFARSTCIKPNVSVDLVLVIPKVGMVAFSTCCYFWCVQTCEKKMHLHLALVPGLLKHSKRKCMFLYFL